jgi:hypothetical protein
MADPINWFQVGLGAFGGATIGSITGFAANLYFANRKEEFDKVQFVKKYQSEYHIKRKEHLEKLIANLLEYTYVAEQVRFFEPLVQMMDKIKIDIHNSNLKVSAELGKQPEPLPVTGSEFRYHQQYEKFYNRAKELLPQIFIEAEHYGSIPSVVPKLNDYGLATYVYFLVQSSAEQILVATVTKDFLAKAGYHVTGLIFDLRKLVSFEESMARDADKAVSKLRLPYIEHVSQGVEARTFEPANLDMSLFDSLIKGNQGVHVSNEVFTVQSSANKVLPQQSNDQQQTQS